MEVASKLDEQDANGPNDDLWDAHYLLVNGYDDAEQVFIVQDSQHGADRDADKKIPYENLERDFTMVKQENGYLKEINALLKRK